MITNTCNCKCSFCSRNNLSLRQIEPKLDDLFKAIDILYNTYPSAKFILSGGEPTLSRHFTHILDYVSARFDKVEIQTNGTFNSEIAKKIIPYLEKNVFLQFSLDGLSIYHNKIRGHKVFEDTINNLIFLQDYSSHLSISTTVTASNIDNVLSLSEFLNELKFRRLTVSYVQPLNPRAEQMISSDTWNLFVNDLLLRGHYRVDISKLFDFSLMDRVIDSNREWHGIVNCGRGVTHFYVTPQLDVLPCTCTDLSVGNLLVNDIQDIIQRLEFKKRISVDSSSKCYTCKYLPICNGGCPGLSLKVFGSENMGDIRCPFVYDQALKMGYISKANFL